MKISIEPISSDDNDALSAIIKQVGEEYGAVGEGFGPSDPEVNFMSEAYVDRDRARYFIAKIDGEVVGGCGVARFGENDNICELKKLFILPAARKLGIGRELTLRCLSYATLNGYSECYLDSLDTMTDAISLYLKLGFKQLEKPLAETIHNRCNVWMLKAL